MSKKKVEMPKKKINTSKKKIETSNKTIEPIDPKKDTHSPQIVHEAEITRQHARFKIPAKIEIEGKIYKLKDWSLTGCAVIDLPDNYVKKNLTAKLIFKFDQFETVVDNLKIECLYKKDNYVGCRFTDLTPQQLAILNQIITAYINGDIVTQDDIITAVTKIQMYPKKNKIDEVERKKANAVLFLIFTTLFIIVSFLSYIVYKKTFIIENINGYIDSNITILRAPYPSFITFQKKYKIDENISQSETVAIANLVGGGISRVISPVNGKVFKIFIHNQEYRNVGEPIMAIIDRNASQFINATFDAKDTKKFKIGYIVKIIFNNQELYGKIVKIEYPEDIATQKSKPVENVYANARNFIKVIIQPFQKIDKKWIGSSVYIKVDTFINKIGYINENNTHNFFTAIF